MSFKLREEFDVWESCSDEKSIVDSSFSFGGVQLVGHGKVTNDNCGRFRGFWGCDRVPLHDLITLKGESYKGKVFMRKVFFSCDKP